MFSSEKEMQSWLRDILNDPEGLRRIIYSREDQCETSHTHKKVFQSYKYCLNALSMTHLVCADKDISQFSNEVLKPDFLLYSVETESWIVIELKNIAGPTRQTATELSAYANAIKSYFPGLCDGDIISIVISNEWPTLLKNHLFNEIYWLNKRVLCLKPCWSGTEVRLECLDPNFLVGSQAGHLLSTNCFSGHQICLYGRDIYSGGQLSDLENHIEQIRSAFYRIVNRSVSLSSHGFAFLWRDYREHTQAAYSITMVDVNPYKNSLFSVTCEKGIAGDLQNILNSYESSGNTYSHFDIMEHGELYLKSICRSWPEGANNWENLMLIMEERSELIEFRCWGVVSEIYEDELAAEYERGNIDTKYESPVFGLQFVKSKLFKARVCILSN